MSVTVAERRRGAVRRMLEPRSVAVVGASGRPGSFGERMVLEALRSPARPALHLVHPRHREVQGLPCLPSLADVPGPVDLVLLGVPDEALADQVALARRRGDGGAVAFGGAVGVQQAVLEAAGDLPLVGPSCMGFVNVARGIRALGYLEPPAMEPGGVALVTHSGSAFSALLRTHRRLEYCLAVSSGQELVTTAADHLDYALDQPETRVVGLFLETPRDAPRLRAALGRAAEQDVPVVALAVGGSAVGGSLVAAHSGAVAGADGAWEALFRAYDVRRVRDLDEMVDTLELLSLTTRRRTRSPARLGVATVHDSGGERVLAADLAEAAGVPFAPLTEATRGRLTTLLDDGLHPANPLDVWGNGARTRDLVEGCLRALAEDPGVGVTALAVDLVEEHDGDEQYLEAVADAHDAVSGPVVVLAPTASAVHQPYAARLRAAEIPVLEGMSSGLRALGHLLSARSAARSPAGPAVSRQVGPAPFGAGGAGDLLEALAASGVPVAPTRRAASLEGVVRAASEVGYPVALKTAAVAHKTEVDGVVLRLRDEAELGAAYRRLRRLGDDVLVQAMAPRGVELALGVVRDPHLGPLVVVGSGGVLVELVAERAVALPPLDRHQALALLEELPKVSALLAGFRGAAPADREAVADAVAAVSRLALAWEELEALDVNPLICTPQGVVAVDALVVSR